MPKDLFEEHGIDLLANEPNEKEGILKSLGKGYLNYAKGALRGTGQAIGDLGASAINWPISGVEHLLGRQLPHVPHPHLINENPTSLAESIGQNLGQFTGALALPGGAGFKTAQLANRGYQALRGSKELPLIGKLLAAATGGALEGAAGNEENRKLGGIAGGLLGTAGQAIPSALNFARNIKSKNIAQDIKNTYQNFEKNFEQRFNLSLMAGEEAGANRFLKKQKANLSVLKKAGGTDKKTGTKDLVYALEQFNSHPTLTNAHYAQRDLNKLANLHKYAPEGTAEKKAYNEALKLKNRLLEQITLAFEKSGAKSHGDDYAQARVDYAEKFAPYLNSKAISDLLGKNSQKKPTLRPSKFADKLLEEENFLAQAGHNHPGLLQREKAKIIAKHPLTKLGAVGAAAYLPYEIRKLLEY